VTPSRRRSTGIDRLAEGWEAAWTGGREAGFRKCCAADVHYEDPLLDEPAEGIAALAGHAGRLRGVFPDLRIERAARPLGDDQFACIPWRLLGTQRGELPQLPASDRFVIVHGVHYVELADGRIRRARGFFDVYGAGVQLGLLPRRGTLGETALLALRGFGLRLRDRG